VAKWSVPQLYCIAFFDATGINIRTEMAKTTGVSPDVMTQLLSKKGLASSAQIELVELSGARTGKVMIELAAIRLAHSL
jgi:hypothetical protein